MAKRKKDIDTTALAIGTVLGTASPEVIEMFRIFNHRRMQHTMSCLAKGLTPDEFAEHPTTQELMREHDKAWNQVYEELGIDPNGHYSIDGATGKVTVREPDAAELAAE